MGVLVALGIVGGAIVVLALLARAGGPPSALDRIEQRPTEPGWFVDPLGRFDARWFDGVRWTQHVGRIDAAGQRQQFEDPI